MERPLSSSNNHSKAIDTQCAALLYTSIRFVVASSAGVDAVTSEKRQWTDSEGLAYFCRHLVGLCVTYQRAGSEANEFAIYSGTLISIEGMICFLTAGHILSELAQARDSADVTITKAVLADTFAKSAVSNMPIPFDLKGARLIHFDDDSEGLDFGVIPLSQYYVNLLAKNGMVALEEKNWIHQANVQFDGYAMLGFPEEFVSKQVDGYGNAMVSPTMFRVVRLDAPPEGSKQTRYPRFVGQIDDSNPIESVVGMSGGPIIGFTIRETETRYWIVALQSSWDPGKRIVYACPLPVLGSLLTKAVKGELSTAVDENGQ